MKFGLRFDMRNPPFANTSTADRYDAALEMAGWADRVGGALITVSEHHGSSDGYMPSPIPMIAAMAARTTRIVLIYAALIAPFNDPLRIAEDLVVLDNLTRGRLQVQVGGGYVPGEFAMFGVPPSERPRRVVEVVKTLKAAFTGDPFDYRGRQVHVTPAPFRPGGPAVVLGGSSEASARRAARIADGFVPIDMSVWDAYRDELSKLGRPDPGPNPVQPLTVIAFAEDPEEGWQQMAPYFLHEMNAYGAWQAQADVSKQYRMVPDVDALRATGQYQVLTPEQGIEELRTVPFLALHPMCGGMPIDLAWSSLRLFEEKVLPALS